MLSHTHIKSPDGIYCSHFFAVSFYSELAMYYMYSCKNFCFLSLLSSPPDYREDLAGSVWHNDTSLLFIQFAKNLARDVRACDGTELSCLHCSTSTALPDIYPSQTETTYLTPALMKYTQ